jgi:hypothetical protein
VFGWVEEESAGNSSMQAIFLQYFAQNKHRELKEVELYEKQEAERRDHQRDT